MRVGPLMFGSEVPFEVPATVAFDYLADPRNRPEWQSSLRSVEMLDEGPPHVGMRWIDVTRPGLRPELEIVSLERPEVWAESGTWRGVKALVMLMFEDTPSGCVVTLNVRAVGAGLRRPLGPPVTVVGVLVGESDLRRAARILSSR